MSMFLDSSRTLPDTKEGLGNPDMSGILLDSPTLLLSWPLHPLGQASWSSLHTSDQRPLDAKVQPVNPNARTTAQSLTERKSARRRRLATVCVLLLARPPPPGAASCFPIVEWSAWDEGPGPSPKTKMRVI